CNGYEMLLGDRLSMVSQDTALALEDRYPFKELWIRFYEENIGDPHLVKLLLLAWGNSIGDGRTKNQEVLYANANFCWETLRISGCLRIVISVTVMEAARIRC
ncbi:MAG: hypothetical protein SOV79_06755, partial [Eisenbergiella porci]|uniref:hypothetical protein n=1 Tax=Eisenbergiella porci TaxID=2652274 RepID=UPI002A752A78